MKDIFEGSGSPVSPQGFSNTTATLRTSQDTAALWAILAVETKGFGYFSDKRPKILFERHIFHKRTGGRFSASHSDISNRASGGYLGGPAEYQRLKRAMLLDRQAALESASWGLGQVMGFNAVGIGYASAEAMVNAFVDSEDAQLAGCAAFITSRPALQRAFDQRDWARVAFFYNGESYRKNKYDAKLATFYAQFRAKTPQVEVRGAQARLTYLGFNPKGIDGVMGGGTRTAIEAFQRSKGLNVTGTLDDATEDALSLAAGV